MVPLEVDSNCQQLSRAINLSYSRSAKVNAEVQMTYKLHDFPMNATPCRVVPPKFERIRYPVQILYLQLYK